MLVKRSNYRDPLLFKLLLGKPRTLLPHPISPFLYWSLGNLFLTAEACTQEEKPKYPLLLMRLLWGKVCSWHLTVELRKLSISESSG